MTVHTKRRNHSGIPRPRPAIKEKGRILQEKHTSERLALVLCMRSEGATFTAVANLIGVSVERARQIVRRYERDLKEMSDYLTRPDAFPNYEDIAKATFEHLSRVERAMSSDPRNSPGGAPSPCLVELRSLLAR